MNLPNKPTSLTDAQTLAAYDAAPARYADDWLYTTLEFREVVDGLKGAEILETSEFTSSSSGQTIRQLVARKT